MIYSIRATSTSRSMAVDGCSIMHNAGSGIRLPPVRPPRVVQAPAALDQPSSADGPPSLGAVPRSPDGLRTGAVEQVTAPPTRVGTRSVETEQQP